MKAGPSISRLRIDPLGFAPVDKWTTWWSKSAGFRYAGKTYADD
jgi:hypothetical protein